MKNYRKTIKIVYKYKWIHYKVNLKNLYAGIKIHHKVNAQSVLIAVTFDKYPTALGSDQNENRVKTTQTVEVARDLPKNYLSQDLQKSNNEASAHLQLLSKICARV